MQPSPENRLLARSIIASQFAPPFMFSGVAIALPTMGLELHAGATSLTLVETLFLAGSLSFLLPIGRLADAGDKKSLYKFGLLGFSLTSILISLMTSMPIILCLRFVQGLTSAVFVATGPAILADIVPSEHRGRAFGSSMGAIYSGLTLGPIVAGVLVKWISWRAVFLFGAVILMAGYLLIRRLMPAKAELPVRVLHLPSVLLVVAAALSVVIGSAFVKDGAIAYEVIAAGLAMATTFVFMQRRLEKPLLNVTALMANRVLRNALLVQMLVYTQAMVSMFLLSLYLQVSLRIEPEDTGPVLAVGSVIMAILAPFSGRLADRFRPGVLSSLGIASILVTAVMATTLNEHTSLWFVRGMLAFQGLGFALFSSPNMTIIMNSVASAKVSMASALGAKSRSMGTVTGMLIASILVSIHIGADRVQDHPESMIDIVSSAFVILIIGLSLALLLSIVGEFRDASQATAQLAATQNRVG